MKKGIVACFVVWMIASFIPVHLLAGGEKMRLLSPAEREDLMNRLKTIQAGIRTFEAGFVEERTLKALPSPLVYEGTIYYDRNHLFFMKYHRPVQSILRVQGNEAMIYVIGSGTADIADISTDKGTPAHPDIFNWDPSSFKGKIYSDTHGFWFKETQQKQGAPQVSIFLDKKTLLVNHFSISGENGDITKIVFTDKKMNQPLPPGILNFSLPRGTKLNRLSPP